MHRLSLSDYFLQEEAKKASSSSNNDVGNVRSLKDRHSSMPLMMIMAPKPAPLDDFELPSDNPHIATNKIQVALELEKSFELHWNEDEYVPPLPPAPVQHGSFRIPATSTSTEQTDLMWSSLKKGGEDFDKILAQISDVQLITARNQFQQSPLHIAAEKGYLEIIITLLSRGIDVNAKDKNGWTALHSACHAGQYTASEILLRQGIVHFLERALIDNLGNSSVMVISSSGATPLHYLMKHTIDHSNEKIATIQSIAFKKVFSLLIDKGAILNAQNNFGETPLHHAANLPLGVQLLLENGASPNLCTVSGETPLHYACRNKQERIVQMLLDFGADPNIKGHQGTPLDLAKAVKCQTICDMLSKRALDIPKKPDTLPSPRATSDDASLKGRSVSEELIQKSRLKRGQSFRFHSYGFLIWDDDLIAMMLSQSSGRRLTARNVIITAKAVAEERHLFNVKEDEPFIEDFTCILNGKYQGTMLIFQHCIYFYARNASGIIQIKEAIPFKDIQALNLLTDTPAIYVKTNRGFTFSDFSPAVMEVFNLLEFLRKNREKTGPIVYEGFAIQHVLGAIKNPNDYKEFQERLSDFLNDYKKQGLAASCPCTLQIFDESEGMLDTPEEGKLFISQDEISFFSSGRSTRRIRDISLLQISDVGYQKETSKIQLMCQQLRYSFYNFPSTYYYEKMLEITKSAWSSAQKRNFLLNFLVIGATSLVGILVVKELTAAGAWVQAAIPQEDFNSPAANRVRSLGASVISINYQDPKSVMKALTGITRIFWILDSEEDALYQTKSILKAIKQYRMDLIVKISGMKAAAEEVVSENDKNKLKRYLQEDQEYKPNESISHQLSIDRQAEVMIELSGFNYVFIRCSMLMQQFACLPIKSQGIFHFPIEKAAVSWVDARDVTCAITNLLLSEDRNIINTRFLLTGREAITCKQVASILSRSIDKRVQYISVSEMEAIQSITGSSMKTSNTKSMLELYEFARKGNMATVSNHIKDLTGYEPYGFEQFVNEHIMFFKHNYQHQLDDNTQILANFANIDIGNTGSINRTQFINSLGYTMATIGLSDAIFAALDFKRDDVVTKKEFMAGMSIFLQGSVEEKLDMAFKILDTNHDGYVTYEEFSILVSQLKSIFSTRCYEITGFLNFVLKYIFLENEGVSKHANAISREEWKERSLKNLKYIHSLGLLTTPMISKGQENKDRSILFGHENWELIFNILLCITKSVLRVAEKDVSEIIDVYFTEEHSETLADTNADATAWVITDYAPLVFKKIRGLFGIDESEFLHSVGVGNIIASLFLGDLHMPQEGQSSGRSGCSFFRSSDKKYLIKTIAPEEDSMFRKILISYTNHVEANPNTLLTRFLGLYRIKKGASGKEISFVVMANVFDPTIDIIEQYDLKGSTVGRHVQIEDENDAAEIALKDLNFKHKITIGISMKARLMEQIEKDCKFMEGHTICDYSLLIGISVLQTPIETVPDAKKDVSIFKKVYGGMLSEDKNVLYFIGIIDVLTPYNYKKMGEYLFKRLIHDKNKISAIPPDRYRARFQNYVASIVE